MRRARVGRRRARARRNIGTEGLRVVVEAPKGIKSLEKAREDLATTATPTARTTRTKAPKANVASIFRFVAFARDEDDAQPCGRHRAMERHRSGARRLSRHRTQPGFLSIIVRQLDCSADGEESTCRVPQSIRG